MLFCLRPEEVVVDCSFPITVLVSKQTFIDLSLAKGKQVLLVFKPSTVHVIPRCRTA
ncbi:MAG: TOBE domain-containing protein [Deltaproteobacteria bacterium]|nr:TOBE domain-containing protein [Deltaproteobacteria bacterium]